MYEVASGVTQHTVYDKHFFVIGVICQKINPTKN